MFLKIFMLVFLFLIIINITSSWSSVINTILKSSATLPKTGGLKPDLIEAVAIGAQMAIDECQNVFKWDRWNCPQSSFSRKFKQLLTKEKAYTEAIVAAGIVYSITRNCSRGELDDCNCNRNDKKFNENNQTINKIEKDWTWNVDNGCTNTNYGEQIVLKFIQNSNDKNIGDIQTLTNQHNNRIGRQIVGQSMVRHCRCIGISGSCSLQTCRMQLPSFTTIAQDLRERYRKAIRLRYNHLSDSNRIRSNFLERLQSNYQKNLIYLDESPNYCYSNNKIGWTGTKGRICSKSNGESVDLNERRSCKNLCRSCGYKVRKDTKSLNYRCNCKFIWCCEVKCEICTKHLEEYFCSD